MNLIINGSKQEGVLVKAINHEEVLKKVLDTIGGEIKTSRITGGNGGKSIYTENLLINITSDKGVFPTQTYSRVFDFNKEESELLSYLSEKDFKDVNQYLILKRDGVIN